MTNTSIVVACALLASSSQAFMPAPSAMHQARPTSAMTMSANKQAAALAAGAVILAGGAFAPPAQAGWFGGSNNAVQHVQQKGAEAKSLVNDAANSVKGAADSITNNDAPASDNDGNQRWGDLSANAKSTALEGAGIEGDIASKAQALKGRSPDQLKDGAKSAARNLKSEVKQNARGAVQTGKNIANAAGTSNTAFGGTVAGTAEAIGSEIKGALGNPNLAGAQASKAANGVGNGGNQVELGQNNRVERAADSGREKVINLASAVSRDLNPAGAPTLRDGVESARDTAKDTVAKGVEAVNDAKRGVTQRDGAVDRVKDNAREAAPVFGKLANEGVDRMAETLGNK